MKTGETKKELCHAEEVFNFDSFFRLKTNVLSDAFLERFANVCFSLCHP